MTRRAGFVRIPINQQEALRLVREVILLQKVMRPGSASLLCPDTPIQDPNIALLIRQILKASRFPRKYIEVKREQAESLARLWEAYLIRRVFGAPLFFLPDFVARSRQFMASKGRPKLSRAQVQRRASGEMSAFYDEREERRMRKREQLSAWIEKSIESGFTLLTAPPPP